MKWSQIISFLGCLSIGYMPLHSLLATCPIEEEVCSCPSLQWGKIEFLIYSIRKNPVPVPLVTFASTADPLPGAIGQPGTRLLLGDGNIPMGVLQGFRLTLGSWMNEEKKWGVEGNYFLLPKVVTDKYEDTSGLVGFPNLAIPIFDVTGIWGLNGVPGETIFNLVGPLFGEPGFDGHFHLQLTSLLQGVECNGILHLDDYCHFRLEGLGGFRWLHLHESLTFEGKTRADFPQVPAFYNFRDHFKTENDFFGGQVGLRAEYNQADWHVEGAVKVGIGLLDQQVHIKGSSQTSSGNLFFLTQNTAFTVLRGGVFAQPTNIGHYDHRSLTSMYEANLYASYHITKILQVCMGYSFLWMNKLVRPGDQMDRKINPTRTALAAASRETVGIGTGPIPFGSSGAAPVPQGPLEPHFKFKMTNFWVQGFSIGFLMDF